MKQTESNSYASHTDLCIIKVHIKQHSVAVVLSLHLLQDAVNDSFRSVSLLATSSTTAGLSSVNLHVWLQENIPGECGIS